MGLLAALFLTLVSETTLVRGGTIVDGSGGRPYVADVRISAGRIVEIGKLAKRAGETLIEARGLVVAPGFIDAHSHADGEILSKRDASAAVLQGITTAVAGQDGGSQFPIGSFIARFQAMPATINLASFVGHGTLRRQVLGPDTNRRASTNEIAMMGALLREEMSAGALGLSTGLEYDPGFHASNSEVVSLAKIAAGSKGLYISHVRDEENEVLSAIREVAEISREGKIAAQVSHIKLASKPVWGRAREALSLLEKGRLTADVYPYLYWQSSITVLIPTRDFDDREQWRKGLEEIGGPGNVLLTQYSKNPGWAGKSIAQLAAEQKTDAISIIQRIVESTRDGGSESVVVHAMRESDLVAFMKHPRVMFCTDGGLSSRHPRGAGSYPRVLGRYVREQKLIPLQEAIRKMTSFPAQRFGLKDRGLIKSGYAADLVVFNARTIADRADLNHPSAPPTGVDHVFTNGVQVVRNGKLTRARPGQFLARGGAGRG